MPLHSKTRKTAHSGMTGRASATVRPDLPDQTSIVSETTVVSPKGNRYRILETDEKDAYDPLVVRKRKDP